MTAPFTPFSNPWRCPRRDELIRRYLTGDESAHGALVELTFVAPPDEQWTFILELIAAAPDDDDVLAHIAAGPVEGLLGRHGPAVIDRVEDLADRSAKFRRILRGVWQHMTPDDVWARVCAARVGRN
jgi:hypothetical protein